MKPLPLSIRALVPGCLALLALPGIALAAPDLSGKSGAFKANYQAFYVACLETSAGARTAVSKCESDAMGKAEREEIKMSAVTTPNLPTAITGPTKPVTLPSGGAAQDVAENAAAIEAYKDSDYIVEVPVRITNYRIPPTQKIADAQPKLRCLLFTNNGDQMVGNKPLPVFVNEGDNFEGTLIVHFKKPENAKADMFVSSGVCKLVGYNLEPVCWETLMDKPKSFCTGRWSLSDGPSREWR